MAEKTKKGVLLPVVLDRKYARSDEECSVESLDVSDFAVQESVRAHRSGGYHAAPVPAETTRIADSLYFILGDILALLLAGIVGALFGWISGAPFSIDGWMFLLVPIWLMTARGLGLYPGWGLTSVDELRRISKVSAIVYPTMILFFVFSDLTLGAGFMAFGLSFVLSIVLVNTFRNRVAQNLTDSGRGGQTTVIYGADNSGRQVLASIRRSIRSGLIPVAFLDDDPGKWGQIVDGLPVLGDTNLVFPGASTAIIALPRSSRDNLDSLIKGPLSYYQRIVTIPEWDTLTATSVQSFDEGSFFGINLAKSPVHPDNHALKRVLDIVLTVLAIPFWVPVGFLTALLLFVETRCNPLKSYVIKNARKKRFLVYRFDTPFRYHAFLHRTRLQHLPALINVLTGTLSLVGPVAWEFAPAPASASASAPAPSEPRSSIIPGTIRPGLTGLSVPPIASITSPEDPEKSERYYIGHWSPWLDLLVIGHATMRLLLSWIGRA